MSGIVLVCNGWSDPERIDFCQQTAQAALTSCQEAAESSAVCYDCLPASPRRSVETIASDSLRIGQNVASRINSIERNGGETEPVPQPKSKESHQSWGPASVSPQCAAVFATLLAFV
jgi:hypothetical protein